MVAKIRRDVADSQPPVRRPIVSVGTDELLQELCILPVPALMLAINRLAILVGMKVEAIEKIALGNGRVGLQSNGCFIRRHRFVKFSLFAEDGAKIRVRLWSPGLRGNGFSAGDESFVDMPLLLK